jgi:hypothetical protein
VKALRSRPLEWLVGVSVFKISDYLFDYGLYPFAVANLGPIWGGSLMTLLSLTVCVAWIRVYDRLKRDWLGIETAKALRAYAGPSRWRLWLARLMGRSDAIAFVVLSVRFDPFITTAYLRRGAYGGLTPRDWRVFLGSVLLSNATWTLACFGGIEGFRRLISE